MGGRLRCGVTGLCPGVQGCHRALDLGHRAEHVEVIQRSGWQLISPPPPSSEKMKNWVREGWHCPRAWGGV